MTRPELNTDPFTLASSAIDFMESMRRGDWTLTSIHEGAIASMTFNVNQHGLARRWLSQRIGRVNLYWNINPIRAAITKAALEDITHLERLHVDLDPDPHSTVPLEAQRAEILALLQDSERLLAAGLPGVPTTIIDSGGGYWAFWELVEPLAITGATEQDRREAAHALGGHNKWIAEQLNKHYGLHYADKCHNIDRIARLPATHNIPTAKKRKESGRVTTMACAIEGSGLTFTLDQFGYSEDLGPAGPARAEIDKVAITTGDWAPLPSGDAWAAVQELVRRYPEVKPKTSELILMGAYLHPEGENLPTKVEDGQFVNDRNAVFHRVNMALQRAGVPLGLVAAILTDPRFPVSEHARFPANKGVVSHREVTGADLRRFVDKQVKKAAAKLKKMALDARIAAEALDGASRAETSTSRAETSTSRAETSTSRAETSSNAPEAGGGGGGAGEPPSPPGGGDEPPEEPDYDNPAGIFPPTMRLGEIITEMNRRHAVLLHEGAKARVLSWERTELDFSREVPVLQTFDDFRNRYCNQMVNIGNDRNGNPTMRPLGKVWLEHHARRQFLALRFLPGEEAEVGGYLNMWRGYAVESRAGDWSLMQQHIFEVLAEGNPEYAAYITKWAAWSVQNPDKPAEVALVFKGRKGTGKGTFARALKRLFGQHGLQITSSSHLTGRFNQHLRDCCLLYADEAIAPQDKRAEGVLKGLITEPELTIEGKGANLIQARNRLHIVMASNEDWVVPAGMDERRFAIFQTTNTYQGDRTYFSALNAQLDNGGMEAMLHDLATMDLGDWHPRYGVPKTAALQEQKERSLGPVEQFILNILEEGHIPGLKFSNRPNLLYSRDQGNDPGLFTLMRKHSPSLHDQSDHILGRSLSEWGCTRYSNGAARGWAFPTLEVMRKAWEKRYGERDWPPVAYWDAGYAPAGSSEEERQLYVNGYINADPALEMPF